MLQKLFLFIILISTSFIYAQKLDAVRIEVASDIDIEHFHVEPIGADGLLIFYESGEVNKEKKRKWYFGLFDIKLKQQWLKFVPLYDKMEFVSTTITNGNVYFLFKNINSERFDYGYYEIVIYNIKNQSFTQVSGSIPLKAVVAGFEVIDNTACIALNIKKYTTDVVFVNLVTGDVNPIHINEGVQGYIETMFADIAHRVFYVVVKQNKDRRYITDHIISYSVSGSMLKEIDIENTETIKYFRDYVFVLRNNNELLIFGTYDILTGRTLSFKDVEDEKEAKNAGMFFMKIADGKQQSLYFYDFMGFGNINGTIRLKDVSNLKTTNDSVPLQKSNQLISTSFSLSEPDVFKTENDNYIFSAEAYRPYYRSETRMDYVFYGRPYP